jgi:uncharacterized protein
MDSYRVGDITVISQDLVGEIQRQYQLSWQGIHGISHFLRVRENGLRLTEATGAKRDVVELFAFLHDARRQNDHRDPAHGRRAADFVRSLQGTLFELAQEDLDLLAFACEFHTDGLIDADVTVQTCWDSDRLDLGRAGILPRASKLCTAAAKVPETIRWAYERSVSGQGRMRSTFTRLVGGSGAG